MKNRFHTRSWLATLGALFRLCLELSGARSASQVSEINKEGKFTPQNTIFLEVWVCPRSAHQAFLLCNAVGLPQRFQHAPELVGQLARRSIESQALPEIHEQK